MPLAASYTVETHSHTYSVKPHCGRVVIFQSCDDSQQQQRKLLKLHNPILCNIMKDRHASVNVLFEHLMML